MKPRFNTSNFDPYAEEEKLVGEIQSTIPKEKSGDTIYWDHQSSPKCPLERVELFKCSACDETHAGLSPQDLSRLFNRTEDWAYDLIEEDIIPFVKGTYYHIQSGEHLEWTLIPLLAVEQIARKPELLEEGGWRDGN